MRDVASSSTPSSKVADNATAPKSSPQPATQSTPSGRQTNSPGNTPCRANSFVPSTAVLMADGSTKAIDDVELGDRVWAADPATGEAGARSVLDLIVGVGTKELVDVTVDGSTVTATGGHPFWVDSQGEWVDAADVQVGDFLLDEHGVTLLVDDVDVRLVTDATVHNLTVEGLHTFYVNVGDQFVLTHNCGKAGTCPQCAPRALPAGSPGRVVGNALDPHELAQAQSIVDFRGGTFVGNAQRGAPGIDGTLNGVNASLKTYSGSSPAGVLRHASRAESSAANAGFTGVEVFIDAPGVSRATLVDFGRNGPLSAIPSQGTVSSIYVNTADGWVVFPG